MTDEQHSLLKASDINSMDAFEFRHPLLGVNAEDAKLAEVTRIDLGQSLYVELPGNAYVNEFLIPNFYFHMVTAYDILRMAGVPIGKRDYMMHLVPLIRKNEA